MGNLAVGGGGGAKVPSGIPILRISHPLRTSSWETPTSSRPSTLRGLRSRIIPTSYHHKMGASENVSGNPKPNHPLLRTGQPTQLPNRKFPKNQPSQSLGKKSSFSRNPMGLLFKLGLTSAGRKQQNLRFHSKKRPL